MYSLESLDYSIEQNTHRALEAYSSTSISNEGIFNLFRSHQQGFLSRFSQLIGASQLYKSFELQFTSNLLDKIATYLRSAGEKGIANIDQVFATVTRLGLGAKTIQRGLTGSIENLHYSHEGLLSVQQAQPILQRIKNSMATIGKIIGSLISKVGPGSGIANKLISLYKAISSKVLSIISKARGK